MMPPKSTMMYPPLISSMKELSKKCHNLNDTVFAMLDQMQSIEAYIQTIQQNHNPITPSNNSSNQNFPCYT